MITDSLSLSLSLEFPGISITPEMIASLYQLEKGYVPVHRPQPLPVITPPPISVPIVTPPVNTPPGPPHPHARGAPLLTPHKPVHQSAFLWLSERVVEWKFMGRKLELEEFDLERIARENPQQTSEQVYQMLVTWQMRKGESETTYDKLLDTLEFAEKNIKLCREFVEYVNERERSQ